MNKNKQIELIRKRNSDLNKKLDDMQFQLQYNKELNQGSYQKAKDLIVELNSIKTEWQSALNELYEKQEKYQELINDLREMRDEMIRNGFKRPWYKRIFMRKNK